MISVMCGGSGFRNQTWWGLGWDVHPAAGAWAALEARRRCVRRSPASAGQQDSRTAPPGTRAPGPGGCMPSARGGTAGMPRREAPASTPRQTLHHRYWTHTRCAGLPPVNSPQRPSRQLFFLNSQGDAVKVLHSICQQIWKTQQWPQDWKRSIFIPIPKKGNAKECSNYCAVALILHASKIMLKILQVRFSNMWNEPPEFQAGFRKGRGPRDQIANICLIIRKAREFQKNIYFCFIDYAKAFDCVDHNKLENLQEMGIPDHLTCLLTNLYAGQEATVRTGHGTTDWFQIRKGVCQGCILSPFFCAEYIMQNARLEEAEAAVKIARRNINNLRHADDTTLMAES